MTDPGIALARAALKNQGHRPERKAIEDYGQSGEHFTVRCKDCGKAAFVWRESGLSRYDVTGEAGLFDQTCPFYGDQTRRSS